MKILSKNFIYFAFLIIGSCASRSNFVTEHKDFWFQDSDKGLFYCKSNVGENGSADPTCFEAGFRIYDGSVKSSKK